MKSFAAAGLLVLLLAGCVSQPTTEPSSNPDDEAAMRFLDRVMPGEYGNRLQATQQGVAHRLLRVQTMDSADANTRLYLLAQSDPAAATNDVQRRSWYRISSTLTGPELKFLPDRGGQPGPALPGCNIRLFPAADGQSLAGQSDPEQCRAPGPDGQATGLTKEVRLSPSGIAIADKLQSADGQVLHQEQLEFQRRLSFTGWAGMRPDRASQAGERGNWRVSQPYELDSEGGVVILKDAANDAMGYGLRLRRGTYPNSTTQILRLELLKVEESEEPKLLAYAFGDVNSTRLGLNLDWFQAGIVRSEK